MVRFSDMLGGNGDAEDARETSPPPPALETDDARGTGDEPESSVDPDPTDPDPTDPDPVDSPQDVLERLTQYATSARAADEAQASDPVPASSSEPASSEASDATEEPAAAEEVGPVGDDLLPRPKGVVRRAGWSHKRRP